MANIVILTESRLRSMIYEAINEVFKTVQNGVQEFGPGASSKKQRFAKPLWDLIQRNYSYIGGCKSFDEQNGDGGFNDFVYGPYVWKIYFGENSRDLQGIVVYKQTKYGRKRVCSAATNREAYQQMIDNDFIKSNHVYAEVSGKSENVMNKDDRTNWVNKNQVGQILGKEVFLNQDEKADSHEKLPYADRHYYRYINGEKHRKAMCGNPAIPG